MNNKDIRLDLLRKLQSNPKYTQRELSQEMGISLGKANYCMQKLTERGWVKLTNFSRNSNAMSYMYLLTPKGIEQKAKLSTLFLKTKLDDFEILKDEIIQLKLDKKEMANERRQDPLSSLITPGKT
jgi:EPS-associated MarR family transcriptional regulator